MEVWKFYNLPVACKLDNQESSWCNLESEGLRIGQPVLSLWLWVQKPESQEPHWSAGEQKKVDVLAYAESEFVLPLPFCSVQALSDLDDANLLGEDVCSVYWFKC